MFSMFIFKGFSVFLMLYFFAVGFHVFWIQHFIGIHFSLIYFFVFWADFSYNNVSCLSCSFRGYSLEIQNKEAKYAVVALVGFELMTPLLLGSSSVCDNLRETR